MGFFATLGITVFCVVMLNVIMLSVHCLVVRLSVIMLSVVRLNVIAPILQHRWLKVLMQTK